MRNRFTLMREEVEVQRRKVDGREQEVFAAQYQNVGLQEELDKMRQQLKATEEERDVLKTSLKEEEVARIAAEGKIPLPVSYEPDEFSSPKKKKKQQEKPDVFRDDDDPYAMDDAAKLTVLRGAYKQELRRRKEADSQVEFMKMECQFQCCPCRVAEKKGTVFVHDKNASNNTTGAKGDVDKVFQTEPAESTTDTERITKDDAIPCIGTSSIATTPEQFSKAPPSERPETPSAVSTPRFQSTSVPATPQSVLEPEEHQSLVQFSPTSGTFRTTQIPSIPCSSRGSSPARDIPQTPTALLRFSPQFPTTSITIPVPIQETTPEAPCPPKQRFPTTPRTLPNPPPHTAHAFNSTTTSVPLAAAPSPAPFTPSATMTREEALEQIRQRRGRARSIAAGHATPRKQMVDLAGLKRDISAPAGKGLLENRVL